MSEELDYLTIVEEAVKTYYAKYGTDEFDIDTIVVEAELVLSGSLGLSIGEFYKTINAGDKAVMYHMDRVLDMLWDVYRGDFNDQCGCC